MRTAIFFAATSTIIILAGTEWYCTPRTGAAVDGPSPSCPLPTRIFASGRVEGRQEEIELISAISGRVVEVLVVPGQQVRQGQLLMRVDDREYVQQVTLAQARLDAAIATLELIMNGPTTAEREEVAALYQAKLAQKKRLQTKWERVWRLRQVDAASQRESDDIRTELESTTAELAAAKARWNHTLMLPRLEDTRIAKARTEAAIAKLELARVALERTRLTSPSNAQVLRVNVQPGEFASAEPSIVMVDNTSMFVRAFVEELDAPRVDVGMRASIVADGLPGERLEGQVCRVSPVMGRKEIWTNRPDERVDTMTREVWIELGDPQMESLVFGLRVDVFIELSDSNTHRERLSPGPLAAEGTDANPPRNRSRTVGGYVANPRP